MQEIVSRKKNGRVSNLIALAAREARQNTAKMIVGILGSKIIAHIFSMVAGVVIARFLGPTGKGIVTALLVVPTFVASSGHLGIPIANIYFMGKKRNPEEIFANTTAFVVVASIIYLGFCLMALPWLERSYFEGVTSNLMIALALLTIPLLLAKHFLIDLLRGLEKYKEYNYQNIQQHLLRLLLVLLYVYTVGLTVEAVLVATVAAFLLPNIYCFVVVIKRVPLRLSKLSWRQFRESVWYGLREYLGNLTATLNIKIDLLILAAFMDKSDIGIYSVAIAISELFLFVPDSISVVLLPKIAKSSNDKIRTIMKKSMISNGLILFAGWLAFAAVGSWLVDMLYGEKFSDVYHLAVIILLGAILLSFSQILNKYFSGIGKPEVKSIARLLNLPFKAAAMYLLIKYYGLTGAAWSFVVTTACLLIVTLFCYLQTRKALGEKREDQASA